MALVDDQERPVADGAVALPGRPLGARLLHEALRSESCFPHASGPRAPVHRRAPGPSPLSRLMSFALPAALEQNKAAEAGRALLGRAALESSAQCHRIARLAQRELARRKSASDGLLYGGGGVGARGRARTF